MAAVDSTVNHPESTCAWPDGLWPSPAQHEIPADDPWRTSRSQHERHFELVAATGKRPLDPCPPNHLQTMKVSRSLRHYHPLSKMNIALGFRANSGSKYPGNVRGFPLRCTEVRDDFTFREVWDRRATWHIKGLLVPTSRNHPGVPGLRSLIPSIGLQGTLCPSRPASVSYAGTQDRNAVLRAPLSNISRAHGHGTLLRYKNQVSLWVPTSSIMSSVLPTFASAPVSSTRTLFFKPDLETKSLFVSE